MYKCGFWDAKFNDFHHKITIFLPVNQPVFSTFSVFRHGSTVYFKKFCCNNFLLSFCPFSSKSFLFFYSAISSLMT